MVVSKLVPDAYQVDIARGGKARRRVVEKKREAAGEGTLEIMGWWGEEGYARRE